ncbi:MAG TPA: hypothetical protein VGI19_09240 [Candidatus Cybelea sp.]|jgi:hypothetical protein
MDSVELGDILTFAARSIFIILATLALAACGDFVGRWQSDALPMPQANSTLAAKIALGAESTRSWAFAEAKREDLLYASDLDLHKVFVLSLPTGKLVGTLSFSDLPWGLCSDRAGHVFVTHFRLHGSRGTITEFGHGDPKPITSRSLPVGESGACAVDATSGNVAVTSGGSPKGGNTVSIFAAPLQKETPPRVIETPSTLGAVLYCAYDSYGNLFLTPIEYSTGPMLVELQPGTNSLTSINLNGSRFGGGPLQWQGTYMATTLPTVEHVTVSGGRGEVIGTTQLKRVNNKVFGSSQFWIQDRKIIAPFGCRTEHCRIEGDSLGVWTYPGGSLVKVIHGFGARALLGVTLSKVAR